MEDQNEMTSAVRIFMMMERDWTFFLCMVECEVREDVVMKNFEEGKKLVASCTQELESIRGRIEKVVSGNQEPPQIEPLDIV